MKNTSGKMILKLCVYVVVGYTAFITLYCTFITAGISGIQLQLGSATILFLYLSRPRAALVDWGHIKGFKKGKLVKFQVSKINQ